jgi:hypothetical protein
LRRWSDVVNGRLANPHVGGPWRLQELPDAGLKLGGLSDDSPAYGRRYAVFHNQVELGALEVSDFDYDTENPRVIVLIELQFARLLSFQNIRDFFGAIVQHICDPKEHTYAWQAIEHAILEMLWRTQRISQFTDLHETYYGDLELRLDGSATSFLERRARLRRQAASRGGQIRKV